MRTESRALQSNFDLVLDIINLNNYHERSRISPGEIELYCLKIDTPLRCHYDRTRRFIVHDTQWSVGFVPLAFNNMPACYKYKYSIADLRKKCRPNASESRLKLSQEV
jgi:hypothetical protein